MMISEANTVAGNVVFRDDVERVSDAFLKETIDINRSPVDNENANGDSGNTGNENLGEPLLNQSSQSSFSDSQAVPSGNPIPQPTVYEEIVRSIVQSQENIIGPVAVMKAQGVNGLQIDWDAKRVTITSDPLTVVDTLIGQYQALFGQISVQVCRDAAAKYISVIPQEQLPSKLR